MKYQDLFSLKNRRFVCVEVLRPSQPNGVMLSAVEKKKKKKIEEKKLKCCLPQILLGALRVKKTEYNV